MRGSHGDEKRGGASAKHRHNNLSMPALQSALTGDGDCGAGDVITERNQNADNMDGGVEITGMRSDHPPNSTTMTEGGGASAMGAKILQASATKLFDAPAHAAARPPVVHAGRDHGRSPDPIGEVGGEIVMKGGC